MRQVKIATGILFKRISIVFFLTSFSITAQDLIHYEITPVITGNRTNLHVFVTFKTDTNPITITLPTDNYGTPDIHNYVTSFKGINNTTIKGSSNVIERIVTPDSNGNIAIEYVISYDPVKVNSSSFGPIVHQDYFSVAGCQWLLHIGEDKKARNYSIQLLNEPTDWVLHSSIGQDAKNLKTRASYNDLISSRIGGGGQLYTFNVKEKPINVVIKGTFSITPEAMFSSVQRIVKLQRDWFQDYNQPFYNVVINERSDIIAGTAFNNQFVCFLSQNASQKDFNILLSHEMFHNWLPNSIEILRVEGEKTADDDYNENYEWFSEGFTDYFARKILMENALLTINEFAELLNIDLINIADSPLKNTPYSQFVLDRKNNNSGYQHKKIAYWRGALIALKWDSFLQNSKEKNSLSNYIRKLYKYASQKDGKITAQDFFDFTQGFGIDAKKDFEKYIIRGEPILLGQKLPTYFKKEYKVNEINFQNFQPGFDLVKTKKEKRIIGLTKNSNAYHEGLRNGMEYVKSKNSYRGLNGWSKERQMEVTIKVDGAEKSIMFIPYKKHIKIQQIILNEKN